MSADFKPDQYAVRYTNSTGNVVVLGNYSDWGEAWFLSATLPPQGDAKVVHRTITPWEPVLNG